MTAPEDNGLRSLTAGDRVQVFNVNGGRMGQPSGGWDGTVTKVGRKLITVRYGHRYEAVFRLDTGRVNDAYGHYYLMTPGRATERERRSNVLARLREAGMEVRLAHSFPTDTLEAVVAVLDERKEERR